MICDEAHRAKNSKRFDVISLPDLSENEAERNKQIKQDQDLAKQKDGFIKDTEDGRKMFVPHVSLATSAANVARYAKKRIATTATPIKDRVRDLYAQLDLVEPNAWGSTTAWQDRYCDRKPGIYGGFDTTGQSNIEELNARIAHVAHVLDYRQTHRGLPPKRRQSVYIPPEEQCKPSAGFAAQLKEAAKRGPGAILEAQLARSASMKRKSVLSLIESHVESGQKVVVFTGRKADCDKLGDEVRANQAVKHHNAQVWSAHGETSTKARQDIIDDYMAHPGPCVLVGTGAAFGESLNIHDTDAALFVMLPYDPGQLRQWEGRFCRLGQKRSVIIYYIIAEGTVDEHVANILIDKLPAVEKIVGDVELAEAGPVLAGIDQIDPETFAQSVLDCLDFG
jgi:superfamily II DNA or RNA helicase